MVLLCKQKALYVKCCIIANGITDSQGDTLYAEDIKKIFTSFNNQDNFEIYHNDIPIQEVSLLENYISTTDETIGTSIVPSGSWNAVVRVDHPEIQEGLLTGEFGGVSLNNRIAPRCKGNLTGTVRYKDVADAECVIPLLISFVESGANGYGLHVMDYDAYIKKSKNITLDDGNGGHIMDFKEFLNGLKSLIKEAEDTPEEEVVEAAIEKEDEAEEEVEVEEPTIEKEDTDEDVGEDEDEEEEPVIEKEDSTTEEETIEEETEEEATLEERIAKLEEAVAKLIAEEESDEGEESIAEEEVIDEDTPKITKSEKVIVESAPVSTNNNYYEMTGRDPVTGMKLRTKSKIL